MNHGHGSGSWNSETAYYTIHITSESSTHNHPLSRSCFVLSPLETKQAASRPSSLHARTAEELQKSDNESNQLRDTGCARARTAGTAGLRLCRCGWEYRLQQCRQLEGNTGVRGHQVMLCAGLCLPPGLYKYTYATKTPRHKPCSLQVEAVRDRETGRDREGRLAFIS